MGGIICQENCVPKRVVPRWVTVVKPWGAWLTGWGYGVIMCVWFGPVLDRDGGGVDGYALYQIWSKPWYGFTTFPTIHNQDIFHSATYATLNYDAYHIFVPHLHRSQTLP